VRLYSSVSCKKSTTALEQVSTSFQAFGSVPLTFDKLFGLLTNDPMSGLHIHQLKPRKKPPNNRQCLVTHVLTPGAPYKQCLSFEPRLIGILEREIRHIIQRIRQDFDWNAELEWFRWRGPNEVGKQKLANWQIGRIRLEDGVGGFLRGGRGGFDELHAFCILWEVGREGGVNGRVIHGDDVSAAGGVAERHCHDGFCAHGVSDERRIFERVLRQKGLNVVGDSVVSVCVVMRRFAMVARVNCVDGAVKGAGKGTERMLVGQLVQAGNQRDLLANTSVVLFTPE
jgi:hypothetical protein